MGPLAGVGDPIFWGTVRPVLAALGAGIAMSGSLLGPLLLTFGCMWLLRRKVNALWIIMGFFAIGIFGYWIGFLAP